jgi:NarL family two-component system response regulator YdfI
MIKILMADEEARIRQGVRMRLLLEPDFAVVGETNDGWEVLQLVRELQPDVVVTSIRLQGLDGVSVTERLHRDFPHCAVVILSLYDDLATREQMARVGAAAFVSKQEPDGKLIAAIRAAYSHTGKDLE